MNRRKGTVPIYVYLREADYDRLRALAAARGRPMTHLAEDWIHAGLDAAGVEAADPDRRGARD